MARPWQEEWTVESTRCSRCDRRRRRRVVSAVGAGVLLAGVALVAILPAGAEDEEGVTSLESEETTETTVPPPDTTPETTPPGTTTPPEDPALPQESQVSGLGDVGIQQTVVWTGNGTTNGLCDNIQTDPNQPADTQTWLFVLTQPDTSTEPDYTLNADFNPDGAKSDTSQQQGGGNSAVHFTVDTTVGAQLLSASAFEGTDNGNLVVSHCTVPPPQTGSLDVFKSVVGPVPGGTTFTVDVDCDGTEFDRTLAFDSVGDLDSGGPLPIEDIPVGTDCTVTETGTGDADSVAYEVDGVPVLIPPPTVEIDTDGQAVTVAITNTFDEPETGSVEILKVTEGDVGDGTAFRVEVDCAGLAPVLLTFTAPDDLGPKAIDDIPVGTNCDVVETENGGATLVIYDPSGSEGEADPPTVFVGETVQLVTVTNFFPGGEATGSVDVTKTVEGTPPEGATYQVRVFCTDGTDETLQFGADGGTQSVTGILIPGSCTVEEPGQGGASSVTYTPRDTTFDLTIESPERDLTVTNVFDPQVISVAGAQATRTGTGALAFTGSPIATLALAATFLLATGAVLIAVGRRRGRSPAA